MSWPRIAADAIPAVSVAEIREADQRALAVYGIDPLQLMEVAGFQLSRFVGAWLSGVRGKRIGVMAGGGNNGGDALVAARFLISRGAQVLVWLGLPSPQGLMARHLQTVERLGVAPTDGEPAPGESVDVIVDGLLGTGVRLPLRKEASGVIAAMNAAGPPIIAVDVPSGLDADTGAGADACVRASATLTFGLPKRGLIGRPVVGRLFLADIGLPPPPAVDREAVRAAYATGDILEIS